MVDDGLWLLILRKGRVFVPTMARTKAGFYMGIEPIAVVDAHDQAAVEQAIIKTVKRGNPAVPTPSRADYSKKSALLKRANVKSNSAFEEFAQSWKLSKREGAYFIVPYKRRQDSGADEDMIRGEAIPAEVSLEEVVRRLVQRALNS